MPPLTNVTDSQPLLKQIQVDRFLQLSRDLLCVFSPGGQFEWLNPQWESVLGIKLEDVVGKSWIELSHPEDKAFVDTSLKSLLQGSKGQTLPEAISFKSRLVCQDGTYRCFLWQVSWVDPNQIYAVLREVTEVARPFQQALMETEELFHYLVENIRDYAIYMLDQEGCIVSWNQGAERINGYREAEILGQPVSILYLPEDVAVGKPQEEMARAIAEGRFEDESWRVRRDGSQFWVHAVLTALKDEQGQLRGFAKVVRDVTECRMAEEALQQAYNDLERRVEERTEELWRKNEQLEQAHEHLQQLNTELVEQAQDLSQTMQYLKQTQVQLIQSEKMSSLGQLVAGVAHEINNPVNFIFGNLNYATQYIEDLLRLLLVYQQEYPQPTPTIEAVADAIDLEFVAQDLPKLLSSMKLGADRIRQIVLSLRNFSRLDESEKKPVDIHEGIESTLLILQNRLKAKPSLPAIAVIKDYGDIPLVECYPGPLNQVFMNILSNAIDAVEERVAANHHRPHVTLPEPTIHIFTEVLNQQTVAIHIADNGLGITERVKQRLFDPFFTTKPIGKGTGLGLSISYQIVVEKHGGQLRCLSAPGQGTEFIIEIPLNQDNPTASQKALRELLSTNPSMFT